MPSRRVMLISSPHLFGESMEEVLRAADDVELLGPWDMNEDICARIEEVQPNAVVVADEDIRSEEAAHLTAIIMAQFPELPIIRANLSESVVRVFSTHLLPARSADLLETIRNLPAVTADKPSDERSDS
ncbi:MAG: hypothetical protein IT314_05505 [Anaerolineales bacterium]|nr:hypothetical protein [Anaerolineales bacterium]